MSGGEKDERKSENTVYPEREERTVEGRQASFDRLRTNGGAQDERRRSGRTEEHKMNGGA